MKVHCKQVFELRFRPDSTMLDFRGLWAKKISESLGFKDWNVDENEVTVIDKELKRAVFVSHKRFGGILVGQDVGESLPDLASKFLECLFRLDKFRPQEIQRIGVRCQSVVAASGEYAHLMASFNEAMLGGWKKLEDEFGATTKDTGLILDYQSSLCDFKIVSGPMPKNQVKDFIPELSSEELDAVSLYIDLDSWKSSTAHTDKSTLVSLVRKLFANNEDQRRRICDLVGVV